MSKSKKRPEDILANSLMTKISHLYKNVYSNVNLVGRSKFKKVVEQQFGYIPVLNEIDLIFQENDNKLRAAEIKLFKLNNGKFNGSLYDGIGQALTLLRYGFDNVALWHFFLDEIDQNRFDRYGAGTWYFIRNQLRLPLEFTYFKIVNYPENPKFIVMQYTDASKSATLIPINDPNFRITWKYKNPYRNAESATLRQALEEELKLL